MSELLESRHSDVDGFLFVSDHFLFGKGCFRFRDSFAEFGTLAVHALQKLGLSGQFVRTRPKLSFSGAAVRNEFQHSGVSVQETLILTLRVFCTAGVQAARFQRLLRLRTRGGEKDGPHDAAEKQEHGQSGDPEENVSPPAFDPVARIEEIGANC